MLDINNNYKCCGFREIHCLGQYRAPGMAMRDFLTTLMGALPADQLGVRTGRFRYVMFAQAHKQSTYGDRFKAFIEKNKFGTVMETGWNVNPNSSNDLKLFLWTIDWGPLREWAAKHILVPARAPQPPININDPIPQPGHPALLDALLGQPLAPPPNGHVIMGNQAQLDIYDQLLRDVYRPVGGQNG